MFPQKNQRVLSETVIIWTFSEGQENDRVPGLKTLKRH